MPKRYCLKCRSRIKGRTSHIVCENCLLAELKNGEDKKNSQKGKEKIMKDLINQETQSPLEEEEKLEPEPEEPEKVEGEEPSLE